MAILKGENLKKSYGRKVAVADVGFEVEAGEIVGILGPNGAGKTTTFKMIMGILKPDKGKIYLKGEDITNLPIYKRAQKGLGYLSQEPSVFRKLTVKQNILAILETQPLTRRERHDEAVKLLTEFGLIKIHNQLANTLSGGQMRRLEIARSLITSPSVILLDEPFSGLDPIAVKDVQGIIKQLKEKHIGIVLTDHNVRETLLITDSSYIIDEGKILMSGTPEEVVKNDSVKEVYLGKEFKI